MEGDQFTPHGQETPSVVPQNEAYKFTIDDFTLHKMLGKGSFGKVRTLNTGKSVKAVIYYSATGSSRNSFFFLLLAFMVNRMEG